MTATFPGPLSRGSGLGNGELLGSVSEVPAALLTFLLLLLVPMTAGAETVTVQGSADCGDAAKLLGELSQRLVGRDFKRGPDGPIRLVFTSRSDEVTATLELVLEDGSLLSRTISAETCAEAEEVIVFVAAVALDPDADEPITLKASSAEVDEPAQLPAPEISSVPKQFEWGVGLGARVLVGAAPSAMVGPEVFADAGVQGAGLWAPSGRLGISYQARGGFEQPSGTAHFAAWLAVLDACPSRLALGGLSGRVCGEVAAGALLAEGSETFAPARATRPWVVLGVSGLIDLELAASVRLGLRASLDAPLIRDSFLFDGQVFYQVPPLGGSFSGGVGVRFR